MGGTKIFVLQMKDLIRMAVFAALGLILIVLLVILFLPKPSPQTTPSSSSLYIPGTYSSAIILKNQPVDVYVTVTEDTITAVDMAEMDGTQRAFYPLFETAMTDLAAEVLRYQSADIVPVTEYPVTSDILRQAVSAALSQASALR